MTDDGPRLSIRALDNIQGPRWRAPTVRSLATSAEARR